MRWLRRTVDLASAGCQGSRRRVLHALEKLQHARLARRFHVWKRKVGRGAGTAEVVLRLRYVHADPSRRDPGTGGSAGLCGRDPAKLPEATRGVVPWVVLGLVAGR